jgi:hypothetical protein
MQSQQYIISMIEVIILTYAIYPISNIAKLQNKQLT